MSPFSLSALDLVSFLSEIVFRAVKLGASLVNRRKGLTLLLFFKAFIFLSFFLAKQEAVALGSEKIKKVFGK